MKRQLKKKKEEKREKKKEVKKKKRGIAVFAFVFPGGTLRATPYVLGLTEQLKLCLYLAVCSMRGT